MNVIQMFDNEKKIPPKSTEKMCIDNEFRFEMLYRTEHGTWPISMIAELIIVWLKSFENLTEISHQKWIKTMFGETPR